MSSTGAGVAVASRAEADGCADRTARCTAREQQSRRAPARTRHPGMSCARHSCAPTRRGHVLTLVLGGDHDPGRLRAEHAAEGIQPLERDRSYRDGRDRRRVRQPERRSRRRRVPQAVRPAGLHGRERLLQEGEPERRRDAAELSGRGCLRMLGCRDLARSRHGLGDLPALQHRARRGHRRHASPRSGPRRRRRASCRTSCRTATAGRKPPV